MSTPTELWKKWVGRVVDEKFPLRRWLGGSDHSAVFLTERNGGGSRKAAIKLIPAQNLDGDAQLALWANIAKLSHPHLIRLFECGRCQIEGTRLLYVVMECADENLAEILPVRPLSPAEASEMLPPTAEALGFLQRAGFVHGRVAPSNITAVENQLKLSSDGLRKNGEVAGARAPSLYDAPEVATSGPSPAADVWSLGMTLVAVLTQNEPKKSGNAAAVAVPNTIPQPLREIARRCLQADPESRCTVHDIVRRLRALTAEASERVIEEQRPRRRPNAWILGVVVLVALVLGALIAVKVLVGRPEGSATQAQPVAPTNDVPASRSPAPFSKATGVGRGSVRQQILPEVSRSALNTITGQLKVAVQVSVDASGNVSQAKFATHGPSQYFANKAMAAAQRWKFTPPQVNGQATPSEWVLRFQFSRAGTQVVPTEVKP